jgi:hypothetical protein
VTITLQLTAEAARALRGAGPPSPAVEALEGALRAIDAEARPLHRATRDESLMRYFIVELRPGAQPDEALAALRRCEAVEAAYIKPAEELP